MNQVSYDLSKRLKVLDEQYKNMDSTRYSVVQPPVDFVENQKRQKDYFARLTSFDIFTESYCINDDFFRDFQDEIIKEIKKIIKGNQLDELKLIPVLVEKFQNILSKAAILKDDKNFELLSKFSVDSFVFLVTEFLILAPTYNSSQLGECINKMNLIGRYSTHFTVLKRIISDHKVDIRTGRDVAVGLAKEGAEESIGCIVKIIILCLIAFLIATMLGAK